MLVPACGGDDEGAKPTAVSVKGTEYAFALPDRVEGEIVKMRFSNIGRELHEWGLGRLAEGTKLSDVKNELARGGEDLRGVEDVGGVPPMSPGQDITITRKLPEGRYVFICFLPSPRGVPHYELGMIKDFEVAGTSKTELPEPDATVTAREKALELPALKAGEQTLELKNSASKPREFNLLALEPGKDLKDVEAWGEGGFKGKAPATILGAMNSIPPGESVFLDVKLEAGKRYLLGDFENRITKEFTVG
jgi:uncharacterized cupredoxin-like copper-binding protein